MNAITHTEERIAHVNGIALAYDAFGDPSAAPVLLIMGLGAQMIAWDDEFCTQLASRGYRVIRFDNRDVGLSTRFDEAGTPNLLAALQAWQQGQVPEIEAGYSLHDMAADTAGLLDWLGIDSAHIVGVSLGGMIAQILAIHDPVRVRTLTSIMSNSGDLETWSPQVEALTLLLTPPPTDREEYIRHSLNVGRVFNGPAFPFDEARARHRAAQRFDRGLSPGGSARQAVAMIASLGWKEELSKVTAPTLVIHGDADPLIPVAGGIDTANAVPGAKLLVIPGLGHALPPQVWPEMIDAIDRLMASTGASP